MISICSFLLIPFNKKSTLFKSCQHAGALTHAGGSLADSALSLLGGQHIIVSAIVRTQDLLYCNTRTHITS